MQKIKAAGIQRLPDGRLRVRATARCPETGRMKEAQRTLKEGATLEEAMILRDHLKAELSKPPILSQGPQVITVADYAELWLSRKARRWKASTIDKSLQVLESRVLPELGHIFLAQLSRRHISTWIASVESWRKENGELYATASVRSWWRVLRGMLRDAYAEGYLEKEITSRLGPPDTGVYGRQEKGTLTSEDLGRLVQAARRFQPRRYAEVVTLAYSGMRIGELYGLHWEDVDFDTKSITIRRSVWRGEVGTTKTGKARHIPCPSLVFEALREHRQGQLKEQTPGLARGIVFPSIEGEYRRGTSLKKPLNLLADHLDLPVRVTPQVLRRTFNTLLVAAQVDRIVLRSITGHSSEQMTEHYSGIGVELKRAAIERVFEKKEVGT